MLVDFGAVRDRLKPEWREHGRRHVRVHGLPSNSRARAAAVGRVYAVGATALRLLTGSEPDKLALPRTAGLAIDVGKSLQGFPSAFREVFEKMLNPDPDRRAPRLFAAGGSASSASSEVRKVAARATSRATGRAAEERARVGPRATIGTARRLSEGRPTSWQRPTKRCAAANTGARHGRGRKRARRGHRGRTRGRRGRGRKSAGAAARRGAARQREEWRQSRELYRQAKRARQQARRQRRGKRPLHGPPLALAALADDLAVLVVGFVLGVFVPTLLTLLSIVLFGPSLRDAARDVRRGGQEARAHMVQFRSYLLHGAPPASSGARVADESDRNEPGVRVESAPEPKKRVATDEDDDVIDTTGTDVTDRAHRRP